MQAKILIAAMIAVGAMTALCNAHENPSKSPSDVAVNDSSKKPSGETFGDLMKRVLRAGDATVRLDARASRFARKRMQKEEAKTDRKREALQSKNARPYHEIVARYAAEYGVPVGLAHAIIAIESNYRPSARGSAGEIGLMQIKPSTARGLGYSGSVKGLYNPETNIRFGMKYLAKAYELGDGTTCGAILRYNAGHGAKRMNPISAAYCSKVERILASG